MVVLVTVKDTLDVEVDLELHLDEVFLSTLPHNGDLVLNVEVNFNSNTIKIGVTVVSDDLDL